MSVRFVFGLLLVAVTFVIPAFATCSDANWVDDYSGERCYIAGGSMNMKCNEKTNSATCGMRMSSRKWFGPGRISVIAKAAPGPGVATTFYLSTNNGVYDATKSNPWNEIDFEILGQAASSGKIWTNLFTGTAVEHAEMITVPFDTSADFHTYTLDLNGGSVKWIVDGVTYRTQDIGSFPDMQGSINGYHFRAFLSLWGKTQADNFVACPEFVNAFGRLDWNNNGLPLQASFKTVFNPPAPIQKFESYHFNLPLEQSQSVLFKIFAGVALLGTTATLAVAISRKVRKSYHRELLLPVPMVAQEEEEVL